MRRGASFLCLSLSLLACQPDDVTRPGDRWQSPCTNPEACATAGPDLAVTHAELVGIDPGDYVPLDGSVRVRWRVVNRGTVVQQRWGIGIVQQGSGSWDARVDTFPPLLPGDAREGEWTLRVAVPDAPGSDTVRVIVWLREPVKSQTGNGFNWSDWRQPENRDNRLDHLLFRVPVPFYGVELLQAPQYLAPGQPATARVRVTNRSGVDGDGARIALCFFDFDVGCDHRIPPFAHADVPPLAAQASVELDLAGGAEPAPGYEGLDGELTACIAAPATTPAQMTDPTRRHCGAGLPATLLPAGG